MSDDRHEAVSRRAYELWEKDGGVHGRHEDHWHRASKDLDDDAGTAVAPDGTTLDAGGADVAESVGTPADQTPVDGPAAPPVRKPAARRKAAGTPADQTPVDAPVAPPTGAKQGKKTSKTSK